MGGRGGPFLRLGKGLSRRSKASLKEHGPTA